jgi:hypothetical protein
MWNLERNLFSSQSAFKKILRYFAVDPVAQKLLHDLYVVVRVKLHASRIWHSEDSSQLRATAALILEEESVSVSNSYMQSGYQMKHLLYVMLKICAFHPQTLCICYVLFSEETATFPSR